MEYRNFWTKSQSSKCRVTRSKKKGGGSIVIVFFDFLQPPSTLVGGVAITIDGDDGSEVHFSIAIAIAITAIIVIDSAKHALLVIGWCFRVCRGRLGRDIKVGRRQTIFLRR